EPPDHHKTSVGDGLVQTYPPTGGSLTSSFDSVLCLQNSPKRAFAPLLSRESPPGSAKPRVDQALGGKGTRKTDAELLCSPTSLTRAAGPAQGETGSEGVR